MNHFDAINPINPFNVELLNAKIVDRDQLIRRYNEKCAENIQNVKNLESITDTAQQIQKLYAAEKDRKQQLQTENAELRAKLLHKEQRLESMENERINNDTLYKQTIAELEEQMSKSNDKYLKLCESYVDQANILNTNRLLTVPLMRKCTAIRDILQSSGIPFEWDKSPVKSKAKAPITTTTITTEAATGKMKSNKTTTSAAARLTRTFGMQTDLSMAMLNGTTVLKEDKSTQYQQSKATRSTCTSAFIHMADCSTNTTDDLFATRQPISSIAHSNAFVDKAPATFIEPQQQRQQQPQLRRECVLNKATNSTQTTIPNYRTQGTLTHINNVRKRINYARTRSKSNSMFHEVKKEEYLSPCSSPSPSPLPSNSFTTATTPILSQNDPLRLNAQFHNLWQLLGELLCRIAGQQINAPIDEKFTNEMQIIQRICEIQHLIGEKAFASYAKSMRNIDMANDLSDSEMPIVDCPDEQNSRDSIESYNSDKIHITKIRNLSNYSPSVHRDENDHPNEPMNESEQAMPFTPISTPNDRTVNLRETDTRSIESIVTPQASSSSSSSLETLKNTAVSPLEIDAHERSQQSKTLCLLSSNALVGSRGDACSDNQIVGNTIATMIPPQDDDAAHFKVPKRKLSSKPKSNMQLVKKQKTAKVSKSSDNCELHLDSCKYNQMHEFTFQNKLQHHEMMTSLFGDISDDDDDDCIDAQQIQRILNSVSTPKMLSPIKDWPADTRCDSPSPPLSPSPLLQPLDLELEQAISNDDPMIKASEEVQQLKEDVCGMPSVQMFKSNDNNRSQQQQEQEQQQQEEVENEAEEQQEQNEAETMKTMETKLNQSLNENDSCEKPASAVLHCSTNGSTQLNAEATPEIDDFYSPASPKPDDQIVVEQTPLNIPLHTICNAAKPTEAADYEPAHDVSTSSALDQIIYNYMPNIRHELQACTSKLSPAACYLLANLRLTIEKYCRSIEWTRDTVTAVIDRMFAISRQPMHLAIAILEVIEDTNEDLSLEFTPPAPALSVSHQKCLVLVSRVANHVPAFVQYMQFELERRLFTFQSKDKSIPAMTNLMHFCIALLDIESATTAMDRCKVRALIYKCLYYFKCAAVPLVFTVIMAHPHVIPHANSMEHQTDPLVRAIVSVLSNIIYTASSPSEEFKKTAMFYTLKRRYGFFMDKLFPVDAVVDYCIECLRANRLQHVDYALILIAKRQEIEYARDCILDKQLIPLLHQYVAMDLNVNVEHDEKICTILFTIGSIVKTFPLEHSITGYLQMFVTCLDATPRQNIQEAAIAAICQMQRFTGTTEIYKHLASWQPNNPIGARVQVILKTLVYRKAKTFWFSDNSNNGHTIGSGSSDTMMAKRQPQL